MASPPWQLLLGVDLLSLVLCAAIATFFARAHLLFPERGYGVLAYAFGAWGVGYSVVSLSAFGVLDGLPVLDALRTAFLFLGSLLVFLSYLLRRLRVHLRSLHVAAVALGVTALAYLALYLVAPGAAAFSPPLAHLPWVRLVGAVLLLAAALLVLPEIQGRTLAHYSVPAAFVLLALERYTVALLNLAGHGEGIVWSYPWRLAALVLLARVAWPRRSDGQA
ncbi:MAG TPA: hypothetical protein VM582_03150 [Candidatus Thermoplasmatota archaeon]|nr:hypothetical protein [Candidatus Thermoplasmatota archaeon]